MTVICIAEGTHITMNRSRLSHHADVHRSHLSIYGQKMEFTGSLCWHDYLRLFRSRQCSCVHDYASGDHSLGSAFSQSQNQQRQTKLLQNLWNMSLIALLPCVAQNTSYRQVNQSSSLPPRQLQLLGILPAKDLAVRVSKVAQKRKALDWRTLL